MLLRLLVPDVRVPDTIKSLRISPLPPTIKFPTILPSLPTVNDCLV